MSHVRKGIGLCTCLFYDPRIQQGSRLRMNPFVCRGSKRIMISGRRCLSNRSIEVVALFTLNNVLDLGRQATPSPRALVPVTSLERFLSISYSVSLAYFILYYCSHGIRTSDTPIPYLFILIFYVLAETPLSRLSTKPLSCYHLDSYSIFLLSILWNNF